MAYERYIRKNGKIYGPYLYKSIRDENGNVKNIYVGRKNGEGNALLRLLCSIFPFQRKECNGKTSSRLAPVVLLTVLVASIMIVATASATFDSITIQGQLRDISNTVLSGDYNFSFNIYSSFTGGTSLYEKNFTYLTVDENGIYTAILDNVDLDFDQNYYLGVNVNDDGEMSPRLNMTDVGTTFRSNRSEYLGSYTASYFLNTSSEMQTVGGNMTVSDALLIGSGMTAYSSGNIFSIGNMTLDTLNPTSIAAFTLTGKLTAGSNEIEGSFFDINGGQLDFGSLTYDTTLGGGNITDYSIAPVKIGTDALNFTELADTLTLDATLTINSGSAGRHFYINADANDADFRVSSVGETNMLFVNGTNNRVAIGTNSPSQVFEVSESSEGITFDPNSDYSVINTTGGSNLTIHSSGGNVIIKLG